MEPTVRNPYHHALHQINDVEEVIKRITETPAGAMRPVGDTMAAGILTARSNLAIAAALLALADSARP